MVKWAGARVRTPKAVGIIDRLGRVEEMRSAVGAVSGGSRVCPVHQFHHSHVPDRTRRADFQRWAPGLYLVFAEQPLALPPYRMRVHCL